jgi:hypothetical protein
MSGPSSENCPLAVLCLDCLREAPIPDGARQKAQTNETLKGYPTFVDVLHEIKKLCCKAPCQEGGGKPDCAIKHCVERRRYAGCWECADVSCCELLAPLKEFHREAIDHNIA